MSRTPDNPDRGFSATPIHEPDHPDLRELLRKSDVADMFDPIVRRRLGELIVRAMSAPAKRN